ncbi:MAG: FtsX-like permease family protein [Proteobacteria bacterium]|nr:FtsX-like permease family protein [Pseudomonadota bacterium]
MHIHPILAALRKHRLATLLIALEVALACAVLCNACLLIANRIAAMQVVSGVDEHALGLVVLTGFAPEQAVDLNARALSGLREIPGVQSVSVVNSAPFGPRAGAAGVTTDAEGKHFGGVIDFYVGGPGAIDALGLHVVSGRVPTADEYAAVAQYVPKGAPILITRVLAEHLWPGVDPLGKSLWGFDSQFRVIGVLDHFAIPAPGAGEEKDPDWSIFVPALPGPNFAGTYLVRANPADLDRVMRDAAPTIAKIAPDVVFDTEQSRTLGDLRERFFRNDRAMAGLMIGVIAALLGVTALGITGLASFWVQQRTRTIGIRRALGATRRDILGYFQTENLLIVTFGVLPGIAMALGINLVLMTFYELPRLPLLYLPIGAVALWVLGQLAVLAPALRAASVPPVVATRSA